MIKILFFSAALLLGLLFSHIAFAQGTIGGIQVFPSDNPWNRDISNDPVDSNSSNFISNMTSRTKKTLQADFGANWNGGPFGIPYIVVGNSQPLVQVNAVAYPDESDPGPYPIPPNAPIEGGALADGDRHVLVVETNSCMLYELFGAVKKSDTLWECDSSAKFDLKSNALRPIGWTSADAAGLPILPGLVRYEEVAAGEIKHALRFTVSKSQKAYVYPATHYASTITDPSYAPMGLRVRLKASFDISSYTGQAKVILAALKKYGMIVADNGSDWYISGAPDARWSDDNLRTLKQIPGSAFEVVQRGYYPTPNKAPVAKAGSDVTIQLPINSTSLNGSLSSDPDGTISTYNWSKLNGPASFTILNRSSANTSVANLVQGVYTFRLTVTDNKGASAFDDMVVTVKPSNVVLRKFLIDFGGSGYKTLLTNWNNLTTGRVGDGVANLKTSTGASSGVSFTITDSFWQNTVGAFNNNGTTNSSLYPPTATRDSFFLGNWQSFIDNTANIRFAGLSTNVNYDVRLFASRMTTDTTDRSTRYTIKTVSKDLQANNNVSNFVEFTQIKALNNSFDIQISVRPGSTFGFLGVIELTERP